MRRGRRPETRWRVFCPPYRRKSCHRAVAVVAAALLLAGGPARAKAPERSVPQGFVGVVGGGPLFDPAADFEDEVDRMVGAGVESLRVVFDWDAAQPYASTAEVPEDQRGRFRDEGGIPTDWEPTDRIVAAAAARRIRVLPVVVKSPSWAASLPDREISPPADPGTYARFAATLVTRYGPRGTFWHGRPDLEPLPIRRWQLWNEPDIVFFWPDRPFAPGYVTLLRVARAAIRAADPGAEVVLAGLTNDSWNALEDVYAAGGRRHFDAVAVQTFTRTIANLERALGLNRRVMERNGDARKPLSVTEFSWPSSLGRTTRVDPFDTTERGQARRVAASLPRLAALRRRYRIAGVYWETWMGYEVLDYNFDYAGLRRFTARGPVAKPAFFAFRRAALKLEGCRRKSWSATSCATRTGARRAR